MSQRNRLSSVVVLAGVLFGLGAPISALSSNEIAVSPRLQEEASRPLRWIIENSKLDRRKASSEAEAPRAKVRAPERAPRVVEPAQVIAEEKPVERRASLIPAPMPAPTPAPAPVPVARVDDAEMRIAELQVQAPRPSPRPTPPMNLRASAVVPMPEHRNGPVEMIPLMQPGPVVWRGFCGADCEKYFYRVSFKVQADGKVDADSVRLVESNYPKLKRAVLDAVATWRYMPMTEARDEEVVLKISAR